MLQVNRSREEMYMEKEIDYVSMSDIEDSSNDNDLRNSMGYQKPGAKRKNETDFGEEPSNKKGDRRRSPAGEEIRKSFPYHIHSHGNSTGLGATNDPRRAGGPSAFEFFRGPSAGSSAIVLSPSTSSGMVDVDGADMLSRKLSMKLVMPTLSPLILRLPRDGVGEATRTLFAAVMVDERA